MSELLAFPTRAMTALGERRGRPTFFDEVMTELVYFRMTKRQKADLEQVAADLGLGQGQVLRDAVNEFVADYRERKMFVPRRRPKRSAAA